MGKVPKQAKRVFAGEIFEIYQWPQKLYDGSVATFEMAKRADSVAVIAVTETGRVVMVLEEQPTYPRTLGLPTGRVDAGEKPLAAAQRELAEETGYTSSHWELWKSYQPSHKVEWTVWYFVARGVRQTMEQALDPGERIEVTDIAIDEFLDMTTQGQPELSAFHGDIMREILSGGRENLKKFLNKS